MEKREFDFDEPIICCLHNFDISNTITFATDLATRLGVNVNIMEANDNIIDTIKIPDATITKNLYYQNSKFENDYIFVLEHGDESHLFYNNHLIYNLPFVADFNEFSDVNNIYESIYKLKKFGADKVYIGNSDELNLPSAIKFDWLKLSDAILNSKHYILNI